MAYQAHMRAAAPTKESVGALIRSSPKTATAPSGWETLLASHAPPVSIDSNYLSRCPHFQAANVGIPSGVGGILLASHDHVGSSARNIQCVETLVARSRR